MKSSGPVMQGKADPDRDQPAKCRGWLESGGSAGGRPTQPKRNLGEP